MKKFRDFSLININQNLARLQLCYRQKKFFRVSSQTKQLPNNQTSLLCALSGGQDSILTFFLLLHAKKKENLNILYCQHLWQLKNFFAVKFLFQLSFLNKIPYILILPQNLVLTENEAREWRKNSFYRVSQIEHSQISFTGHTETDILEKNLNNLLRGTSPAGLSSFRFLNFRKKTNLLFSSTNLNICFFLQGKKTRTLSQKIFFEELQKKNHNQIKFQCKRKNQQGLIFLKKKGNLLKIKQKLSNRKNFKFCKSSKILNQPPISLNQVPVNKQNFSLITLPLIYKNLSNKNLPIPLTNIFIFSNSKKCLLKNKIIETLIAIKTMCLVQSFSFCFSNKFSTMPVTLEKPLEKTIRFTIARFVNLYKFPVLIDITNFSSNFSRNKIRHQLIPFIRFLVHPNVECLLTNFLKIIYQEHQEREKEIQELFFVFQILLSKSLKKTTCVNSLLNSLELLTIKTWGLVPILLNSKSKTSIEGRENPRINPLHNYSTKKVITNISENQARSFLQKLFFNYKNLILNYSQIIKLDTFY